jgi:methionyl-tRNA synthetase
MAEAPRYYLTTAIDYPNSRPHIGTAFEKIGADVQARYRRMQGFDVFFLMGNDENTVKVSRRAAELGQDPKAYCDEMARQFKEVWKALDVSFDQFIQTSEPRHHEVCRTFIQKVYDNGHIYLGQYEGLYCEGCEEFKKEKQIKEAGGVCPVHNVPPIRRSEPGYFFRLSAFQDRLLKYYEEHPDFIQPASRRNEMVARVREGLLDTPITRAGETWGIRVPFAEEFTIYVWFDALLNYITGVGCGSDEARFAEWWPADTHFIGKDITRFHCALWPAMLWAAGVEAPRRVFGHGFVYIKNEETGTVQKISKSLGNAVEPMDIITKFGSDAFRHYFMRVCPFPGDGEFGWEQFAKTYNADLANNFGNLYSRIAKLLTANFGGVLPGTAGKLPRPIDPALDRAALVGEIQGHVEACRYHQALALVWEKILTPANQYAEAQAPWKLVKTDKEAARQVLFDLTEPLRAATILLKPFLTRGPEVVYRSFSFATPWERVRYEDAAAPAAPAEDLRFLAAVDAKGNVAPLYPRIG